MHAFYLSDPFLMAYIDYLTGAVVGVASLLEKEEGVDARTKNN